MARIRTIKPEFFTSEDIVALSPFARLLYIALWCEADREGRMQWKPKTFKMRYLPADSVDVDELCAEIVRAGLVKLYGDGLAYIPKFSTHQHVNPREAASTLPEPDASVTRGRRVGTRESTVSDAQVGKEGKGRERKGKEGDNDASESDASNPPVVLIPLVDGSEHGVTPQEAQEWADAYPAVDVMQELREMRQWCKANAANRKTPAGIDRFIVRWLAKAQDQGPTRVALRPVEKSQSGIPSAEETKRKQAEEAAIPLADPEKRRAAIALAMGAVKTMGAA
jgi:hypothetical protein